MSDAVPKLEDFSNNDVPICDGTNQLVPINVESTKSDVKCLLLVFI